MGEARRVALLARPGEACEKLRAALREAGGDIVIEADPSTLDPQQLRVAAVETVLVALDPAVEDALEKFDDVLGDRTIEVIFDEADLAARREGWDAARWVRHLSAKLHRHDDVLPPGREPEDDDVAPPAIDIDVASLDDVTLEEVSLDAVELQDTAADEGTSDDDKLDDPSLDSISLDAVAELPDVLDMPDLRGMEIEAVSIEGLDAVESFDAVPGFDTLELPSAPPAPIEFDAPAPTPSSDFGGGLAFTDDINALDFDANDVAPVEPLSAPAFAAGNDVQDFDALLRDLGGENDDAAGDVDASPIPEFAPVEFIPKETPPPSLAFDIPALDAPTAKESELAMPDFSSLSLEAVSDAPMHTATEKATDAPVTPKYREHDLSDLERRISSLSLVGDEGAQAPVAPQAPASDAPAIETPAVASDARGAVLILAGIGGPDAVRQILTALPAGFPRAVLISQRLDGGRYDRLVQQMARAAALPVQLAESAARIVPGHVYIVPPELGVDAGAGLSFAAGAPLIDALPADDSAVLLLSGADAELVDAALALASDGALVAGQSAEGCYDAAAPIALAARGGTAGTPSELVQSLLQRWPA
jgi:chemosensory pili system protein ChpB (putative protein-glutamate methylesterase)